MSAKHYFKKIIHVKHILLHNPSIPIHVLGSLEEAIRVPVPRIYASEAAAYATVRGWRRTRSHPVLPAGRSPVKSEPLRASSGHMQRNGRKRHLSRETLCSREHEESPHEAPFPQEPPSQPSPRPGLPYAIAVLMTNVPSSLRRRATPSVSLLSSRDVGPNSRSSATLTAKPSKAIGFH